MYVYIYIYVHTYDITLSYSISCLYTFICLSQAAANVCEMKRMPASDASIFSVRTPGVLSSVISRTVLRTLCPGIEEALKERRRFGASDLRETKGRQQ